MHTHLVSEDFRLHAAATLLLSKTNDRFIHRMKKGKKGVRCWKQGWGTIHGTRSQCSDSASLALGPVSVTQTGTKDMLVFKDESADKSA